MEIFFIILFTILFAVFIIIGYRRGKKASKNKSIPREGLSSDKGNLKRNV